MTVALLSDNSGGGSEAWPHCPLPGQAADTVLCDPEVCEPPGAGDAGGGDLVRGRERDQSGQHTYTHTHTHTDV